jgi:pyrimidine-specific ribonucleoside hydrolase
MLRPRSRLLLTLTASLLALAATPVAPAHAQVASRTLVINTDLGIDDLVAIAWLVNAPELDIPAILVSGTGLAGCPAAVDDARALLTALGAEGPEIGCGATTPLQGGGPFPNDRRAAAAGLYGLGLPPAPDAGAPSRTAEAILGELLDQAYDPVTILSLAPMTSLGSILTDPDRAVKVASVTASVGALAGPGDVTPAGATAPGAAEQNAHADPQAAENVLESGAPLTIVPLEVARAAALSGTLTDALLAGGEAPTAAFIAQLAAARPELLGEGTNLPYAVAAVSLTNPELLETRERFLRIELQGDEGGALRETEEGFPAQVAVSVDRTAFETALLEGIRAEGVTGPISPAGAVTIRGGASACDLDADGTTAPGLAIVGAESTDEPLVAVLAGLAEGKGTADLETLLQTTSPTDEPPDWLLLAAYLETDAGGTAEDTAELTPGDYAAICITGDEATPRYLVAPQLLTITE